MASITENENDLKEKIIKKGNSFFDTLAVIFIMMTYHAFAWGYVLYNFWNWFVLPVFITLPTITYLNAVGLACFFNVFKNQLNIIPKKESWDDNLTTAMIFLMPIILLVFGFIVRYVYIRY